MKQLGLIIAILFFISCNGKQKPKLEVPHDKETVYDVVYILNGRLFQTKGKVDLNYIPAFKDSSHLDAYWKLDSTWTLLTPNQKDTAKDKNHKPIYDTVAKSYRFNTVWYKLNNEEKRTIKVQVLPI